MRVTTGKAKGRKLALVPGATTRPVGDRVKQAVFSILGPRVRGTRFLDLFAGTGSVGIEALSRGAQQATFVEREERAVRVIRENLAATGLAEQARVLRRDVFKFIASESDARYDLIYVAPPQYQDLWSKTMLALDEHDILAEDGLIIVQIFPKEYHELELAHLRPYDERRYGSTLVVFYERKGEEGDDAGDGAPVAPLG